MRCEGEVCVDTQEPGWSGGMNGRQCRRATEEEKGEDQQVLHNYGAPISCSLDFIIFNAACCFLYAKALNDRACGGSVSILAFART